MLKQEVVVTNKMGLHARPAGELVKLVSGYDSTVTIIKDGNSIDAASIMNILILCAEKGAKLTLQVEGDDEQEAIDELVENFEYGFGGLD